MRARERSFPNTDVTNLHLKTADSLLLAVDAGGTKSTAWLVDVSDAANPRVLGRGRSTGGNPLSVGFAAATKAFSDVAEQARREANRCDERPARAILSIAGAADKDMQRQLIEWAHATGYAQHVAIVSDFLPVLAAGTRDCVGVALISGTGSSAFARAADGRTARCGGWGYLLGDEGSGFAIGRAALQFALRGLETGTAPTPLERTVLESLGAHAVSAVTQAVYHNADVRATIARVAPLVTAAADQNDPQACLILETAAHDLAGLVRRAAKLAGLPTTALDVAASGSVLVNCGSLRTLVHDELQRLGLKGRLQLVDNPLQGCVRLAAAQFEFGLLAWYETY